MTRIRIKIGFSILLVLIATIAVYVGLCNMSYFTIKEVEYSATGSGYNVASDVQNVISGIRGQNLFRFNVSTTEADLMKCEGVSSVEVKKYFPDKVIVKVHYSGFLIRVITEEGYYLADSEKMIKVSKEKFDSYPTLNQVEMADGYASFIVKWGYEEGFVQMLELTRQIDAKSLITSIKYDNNNSNRFERLFVKMSSPDAELCIREPVTYQRLEQAFEYLVDDGIYDLYANALVKRT